MTRITITLNEQEKSALRALSEIEFRDPRQQAALIIRQELERRGLLDIESQADSAPVLSMQAREIKKEGMNVTG